MKVSSASSRKWRTAKASSPLPPRTHKNQPTARGRGRLEEAASRLDPRATAGSVLSTRATAARGASTLRGPAGPTLWAAVRERGRVLKPLVPRGSLEGRCRRDHFLTGKPSPWPSPPCHTQAGRALWDVAQVGCSLHHCCALSQALPPTA